MELSELPPHVVTVIGYEHRYRKVYVTRVWTSSQGNWCITGWDPDAEAGEGGWRTFRVDRLNGKVHRVAKD
jgi:hypothetical protein